MSCHQIGHIVPYEKTQKDGFKKDTAVEKKVISVVCFEKSNLYFLNAILNLANPVQVERIVFQCLLGFISAVVFETDTIYRETYDTE